MKYPQNQFNSLVQALPAVMSHYQMSTDVNDLTVGHRSTLHYKVWQQKNKSDNDPNLIKVEGKRLLALDKSFEMYPDGCNDDHIETAMKAALKTIN